MAKSRGGGRGEEKGGGSKNGPYVCTLHPQLSRGILVDPSVVKLKDSPVVLARFTGSGGVGGSGSTRSLAGHVSY